MSETPIISFNTVNKWYGDFHVLRNIDLQVKKGERIVICGPSGSGKSTSIRTLDPKETAIINIANKPLPFRGWKSNYTVLDKSNPNGNLVNVSSGPGVYKAMQHVSEKMPHIKVLVVDDWQYMSWSVIWWATTASSNC